MLILGGDPGSNGALALWSLNRFGWTQVEAVFDIPAYGEGPQRRVDGSALFKLLVQWPIERAFVELVGAMPSIPDKKTGERRDMGTATSFKFGRSVGAFEAVVEAVIGRHVDLVHPQVWRRYHGIMRKELPEGTSLKTASRALAVKLCPELTDALERAKDENRAEAVLIGRYGALTLKEQKAHEQPTGLEDAAA